MQRLRQCISQQPSSLLNIPDVFNVSEAVLAISAIESTPPSGNQFAQLGRGLALLHNARQPHYGLEEDNYIGLNPQPNSPTENWGEFFTQQRLCHQVALIQNHSVRIRYTDILERTGDRLISFLNQHCQQPSLVHGDLWHGNVLFDQRKVWLIDPAVYYGDREVDLAMTEMFGGFGDSFYTGYDQCYPRTEVYPIKRDIYNLYHYLNHYNLFGGSYLSGCEAGWNRIELL